MTKISLRLVFPRNPRGAVAVFSNEKKEGKKKKKERENVNKRKNKILSYSVGQERLCKNASN